VWLEGYIKEKVRTGGLSTSATSYSAKGSANLERQQVAKMLGVPSLIDEQVSGAKGLQQYELHSICYELQPTGIAICTYNTPVPLPCTTLQHSFAFNGTPP